MRLEGASEGHLVHRAAHSRAKSQCKVVHCSLENLQGYLSSTQGVRICYVGPMRGQTAWSGNIVSDVLPIPVNTSLPLPGNLSSDIGSEVVLKHYQKLLLFSYGRGLMFDVKTRICSQKP